MIEDDHYIDNSRNAHIDTSQFESALLKRLSCSNLGVEESLEYIYNFTFSTTNITPKEPPDNQLICRYLSPSKFLQFVHTRHINFPMATQFSDCWECRVPDDYETAVLCVLKDLGMSANVWTSLVRRKAAGWNVSCWTQLDHHFDDHLMWGFLCGRFAGRRYHRTLRHSEGQSREVR